MSDQHPGQADVPRGDEPSPTNPYGQPYGSPQAGGESGAAGAPNDSPSYPQDQPYGQAPYGQAPHGQDQSYGQAPYGQDQSYGQAPYGQDQSYGQAPYGQPVAPYGAAPTPYGQRSPDQRPGTVTAGAWIAIVMSGLTALGALFMTAIVAVAGDDIVDSVQEQPDFNDVVVDAGSITGAMVAIFGGLAVWSIIALVLAIFTLRRSNAARILLVISAAVSGLLSLLGIASGVTAVTLIASIATIVLVFVGGANDWFARRSSIDFRGMAGPSGPQGY